MRKVAAVGTLLPVDLLLVHAVAQVLLPQPFLPQAAVTASRPRGLPLARRRLESAEFACSPRVIAVCNRLRAV